MNVQENAYIGPWMNVPGSATPWYNTPGVEQTPYFRPGMPPLMSGAMAYPIMYPDIYYRIQPHVMMAADQLDAYGDMMPNQDMIDYMSDGIYDNVTRMNPDLVEYAHEYEMNMRAEAGSADIQQEFGPRRRGVLRDLIAILFLSELFHRRRRRY